MKLTTMVVLVAVVVGAIAPAHAKTVKPAAKSSQQRSIDAIRSSLPKITDAGDKDRWTKNLGLWQHVADKQGDLKAIDYEAIRPELAELTGAIAGLPEDDYKERWEAAEALWEHVFDNAGDLSKADPKQLDRWFGKMQREAAKVKAAGERSRWMHNIALWRSVLPKPAPPASQ